MGERSGYDEGTISWGELSTTDPDGAKRFYADLFGWEADDNPIPDGGTYTTLRLRGKAVAGLAEQREEERSMGIPPHWNNYATVADADEATSRAQELGANAMMGPFDVMEVGRMSVLADPTGAMFFLWQAKEMIGAELVNDVGAMCWNELSTTDVDAAKDFYKQLFGWEYQDFGEGDQGYTVFSGGQTRDGGIRPQSEDERNAGVPPNWMPYFHAESTDDTVATIRDSGGNVMVEPMDVPVAGGGRIAVVADPAGAAFGLFEGEADP